MNYCVILAGGSGTRLWPASREGRPKQFLSLDGKKSLIQHTIERAFAVPGIEKTIIVTHHSQVEALMEQTSGLPSGQKKQIVILSEPEAKNTAPALMLAALYAREQSGASADFLVMPADHVIQPVGKFAADAGKAFRLVRSGFHVTFGIQPRSPETGYGYMERGETAGEGCTVRSFKEKPDSETAEKYLESGSFYWNAGMFCFNTGFFIDEMNIHAPRVVEALGGLEIKPLLNTRRGHEILDISRLLEKVYARCPAISIDYALMEKSSQTAVVPATFEWNDVGSWDEFARLYKGEASPTINVDAHDNHVFSDIPVALCGVSGLIVVHEEGQLLICKKGKTQNVKKVTEKLKNRGESDLV